MILFATSPEPQVVNMGPSVAAQAVSYMGKIQDNTDQLIAVLRDGPPDLEPDNMSIDTLLEQMEQHDTSQRMLNYLLKRRFGIIEIESF